MKHLLMLAAICLACQGVFAQQAYRATIPAGELRWDAKGLSLIPSFAECPSSPATGAPLWNMVLNHGEHTDSVISLNMYTALDLTRFVYPVRKRTSTTTRDG